jgi:Mrp family chromosome partitioning ATPase
MIIDRAIEKLKQTHSTVAAQPRSASVESAHRRTSAPTPVEPPRQLEPRPTFPRFTVDHATAEANRVLMPNMGVADASASYRMLRTRFLQKARVNRWTTLAITSPGPNEGKSLTALNLALSIARDRAADVFLLDLDMRNPSICKYLNVRPHHELVGYFAGECGPEDTLFTIGVDNLAIAGTTMPTDTASELLTGGRFEELIAYITSISASPIVLIDLPPVLVTDEALLVAPRVDATALVVAEGRTRRDSLGRARHLMAEFRFAGVILNCSGERFGANSYYGYGYGYREGQQAKP